MDTSSEIAVGDVVYLKSGSPPLMVEGIDPREGGVATLSWWVDGNINGDAMPVVCLQKEPVHGFEA